MIQEDINNLKKIGLSTYEAKAYIALTSLISAKAEDISTQSNIPRSKIYDVLKSLSEKKFIEIEQGRPLIYNVKSPFEIISAKKEKLVEELDKTASNLNTIYENEITQVQAPIWRISGVKNIISKEVEIINRSKKTLSMRIGFLFEDEIEVLIDALSKKSPDIEINILASPYCHIENKKIDIIKIFESADIPIYKANIPFVKMMISDSKEIIHTYTKFTGEKKSVMLNSAIAIWNQYEDIAKNYEERFENQLNKIKNKKREVV